MTSSEPEQPNYFSKELSFDYETYIEDNRLTCAVESTIRVTSGRWKVLIIRELLQSSKRFNELHRSLFGVTHKVLTQQLREMEKDGIVHRETYQEASPKVEYSLTPLGRSLHPVIDLMHQWGIEYIKQSEAD
ncbi:MAG: helix-turn-helix domain-containing protein [Oculatellaceae cyanobacterium bins.114]|nr:helix-turn-helix domain-containing protein [Oculatellaceae cyanobacterium bins.114]